MLVLTALDALSILIHTAIANTLLGTFTCPTRCAETDTLAAVFRVHMRALIVTDVVINADLVT